MRLSLRVACVLLCAVALRASGPQDWVPARWPGGPLEIGRRGGVDPGFAEILRAWYGPRSLDLLRGTPVNCLLVPWSGGAEAKVEAEQHRLLAPFIDQAHERGVAVVGVVFAGADPRRATESAAKAGLDGLALEGKLAADTAFVSNLRRMWPEKPLIPLGGRDAFRGSTPWAVIATSEGVPPRVRAASEDEAVMATTTSEPWIESNTWLVMALRSAGGGRPVWLGYELEQGTAADYVRAIADAAAAGGHWIVSLDEELQTGLWRGRPEAKAAWSAITAALQHFKQWAQGGSWSPAAVLKVVREPAGAYAEIADEYLNLIHRRRIPFDVVERPVLSEPALRGLRAVLAVDLAPPAPSERTVLESFARQGGTVIAGPTYAPLPEGDEDFVSRALGAGELILCRQEVCDPESVAREMTDWIGASNLPVRLFNAPSTLLSVWRAAQRGAMLVHLVNYASMPSELITIRAQGRYAAVRLYQPGAAPVALSARGGDGSTEVRLERLNVAASILFEP